MIEGTVAMEGKRYSGIDLIKVIAVFFVISIHGLGMTHALATNMAGARAFLILLYRYMVMSCVPLFLIATGYLNGRKQLSLKFYKGILPVISVYLFVCIFNVMYNFQHTKEELTITAAVISVFDFTANNYAWYVEMFIGLFLLIPFLNLTYHHLNSDREKIVLLATLLFLTVLPTVPETFQTEEYQFNIFPRYFTSFFPVTYYFIGVWIRDKQPGFNKALNALLLFLSILFPVLLEFAAAKGGEYVPWIMNGFNSLSACTISFFIFLFFYRLEVKNRFLKWLLKDIARMTLSIYLFSNIVEKLLYPALGEPFRLYIPKMIVLVFVLSLVVSKLQTLLFDGVKKLFSLFRAKTAKDKNLYISSCLKSDTTETDDM